LTEMLSSFLVEVGSSSKNYTELSGRVCVTIGDVVMALINMGINMDGIREFARRDSRHIIPLPQQASQQKQLNLLQAGTRQSHPSHIPHHLPTLPDSHSYIRTPTHKQPVTEYEAIREKAANQKHDVERALVKFLCKTSETISLFDTDDNMFPLIAGKPAYPPYIAALNPTDQIFDFEELEYHYLVANRTEDVKDENESGNEDEDGDEKKELEIKPNSTTNNAILNNPNIDNPYLRAAALPKKPKKSNIPIVTPTSIQSTAHLSGEDSNDATAGPSSALD